MNDVHYLALAYLCGLVLFLAYLYILDRYQKNLHKEIEHLESVVKRSLNSSGSVPEKVPNLQEPPSPEHQPSEGAEHGNR